MVKSRRDPDDFHSISNVLYTTEIKLKCLSKKRIYTCSEKTHFDFYYRIKN